MYIRIELLYFSEHTFKLEVLEKGLRKRVLWIENSELEPYVSIFFSKKPKLLYFFRSKRKVYQQKYHKVKKVKTLKKQYSEH